MGCEPVAVPSPGATSTGSSATPDTPTAPLGTFLGEVHAQNAADMMKIMFGEDFLREHPVS